jgi:hypothetical protein
MGGMKWARAVHHVESLAETCARMATMSSSIFMLRVTQLWVVGDILGPPRDLDTVTAVLCVDRPAEEVAWWTVPAGAEHWSNATRLEKNPVVAWWRSARVPVWNHRIERPALIWDEASGVAEDTVAALREGRGESVRIAAPEPDALRSRLEAELAVSLAAMTAAAREYEEQRWRPGRLERTADPLWRACDGYLDVLAAVTGSAPDQG